MPSTAQSVPSFEDNYNFDYQSFYESMDQNAMGNPYFNGEEGLPKWIRQLFGNDVDAMKRVREAQANTAYERASIESARAWSEYMDNTQIQRRVKDIEAAGLNPWLAVQNGISGSGAPSVDTGGSAQNTTHSGQSDTLLRSLLMLVGFMFGKGSTSGKALSEAQERFLKNLA